MKSLWVPVSGAIAQQQKVDTIANNIANANSPGFKKDQVVFQEHLTALEKDHGDLNLRNDDWKPEDFYHTQGAENSYVKTSGSYTNHEQGQLIPTNNPLDLAIKGDGFFELITPNGIRYTRKGNFTLSKDGDLVNDQGHRLLGPGNPTIEEDLYNTKANERSLKLPATLTQISIDQNGKIYDKGTEIGAISIVQFNDLHALKKEGSGQFINPSLENIKTKTENLTVHQGHLESSNVNPIAEMSELIKAHRHFEQIQKAITTYDSITNKAMNEIGRF